MKRWVWMIGAAALVLAAGTPEAAQLRLRVMETTDIHMNLLDYDYYQDKATDQFGLARAVTLLKAARAEARNSLFFDNGDLLQGNPMGDLVARVQPLQPGAVHPAYKVMNTLGYDAGNIGNHEFNYGLPFLRQALATAAFPYVNANVYVDDKAGGPEAGKNAFTPYLILEREMVDEAGQAHRLKVGVIGFVPPQIMQWDRANLEGRVTTRGIVETARRFVPEIRAKGADLVVAIPHSGFEKADAAAAAENAVSGLAELPGIDVILFGHAHAEFPGKQFEGYPKVDLARGTINGVPAVMPGRWGDHLGIVDLVLDDAAGAWKVVDSRASIRPIFDRAAKKSLVDADPMVMAAIGDEHKATLDYVRARVTETAAPIHSYFAQVADDPSVQVVSLAQIAYVKTAIQGTDYEKYPVLSAAAPFKAGGRQGWGYYTDIPVGPVAIKNVADLYIYPNTLKAVLISGAELREWLEMSAGQFRRIDPKGAAEQPLLNDDFRSYNFDVIDGVTYEIDVTEPAKYDPAGKVIVPAANRIKNLAFAGRPIDEAAKFIVATNNYRAYGGGNFPGIDATKVIIDAPEENREALIRYFNANPTFNPSADGNWRIRPVPGVSLRFLSGAGAIPHLAANPGIRLVRDNGDGSALFELVP